MLASQVARVKQPQTRLDQIETATCCEPVMKNATMLPGRIFTRVINPPFVCGTNHTPVCACSPWGGEKPRTIRWHSGSRDVLSLTCRVYSAGSGRLDIQPSNCLSDMQHHQQINNGSGRYEGRSPTQCRLRTPSRFCSRTDMRRIRMPL
jgi:hypothetical protein